MHPDKVIREKVTKLTDLPNISKASAADLVLLGINTPSDLLGHDPCVIDVFISITRFINGDSPKPWWEYTAERKARCSENPAAKS